MLVVIVVFIFLQSWRATLIPMITIPVSLIGTFAVMALLGFSINMVTLFGLVLAIGLVVDDAIVVVENVERNMAEFGMSPKEAAIKSMEEVSGAIIGITLGPHGRICAAGVPWWHHRPALQAVLSYHRHYHVFQRDQCSHIKSCALCPDSATRRPWIPECFFQAF